MAEAQKILAEPLYVNALRECREECFDAIRFHIVFRICGDKSEFTRQILPVACDGVSRVGGAVENECLSDVWG